MLRSHNFKEYKGQQFTVDVESTESTEINGLLKAELFS